MEQKQHEAAQNQLEFKEEKSLILFTKSLNEAERDRSLSDYSYLEVSEKIPNQGEFSIEQLYKLKTKLETIKLMLTDKQDTPDAKVSKIQNYLGCTNDSELHFILNKVLSKDDYQTLKMNERENQAEKIENLCYMQNLKQNSEQVKKLENKIVLLQKQVKEKDQLIQNNQYLISQLKAKIQENEKIIVSNQAKLQKHGQIIQELTSKKKGLQIEIQEKQKQLKQIINYKLQTQLKNAQLRAKIQKIQLQKDLRVQNQMNEQYEQLRRRSIESNQMKQTFKDKLEIANKTIKDYIEVTQKQKEQYKLRIKNKQEYILSLENQRDYYQKKYNEEKQQFDKMKAKIGKQIEIKQKEKQRLIKTNQQLTKASSKIIKQQKASYIQSERNLSNKLKTIEQKNTLLETKLAQEQKTKSDNEEKFLKRVKGLQQKITLLQTIIQQQKSKNYENTSKINLASKQTEQAYKQLLNQREHTKSYYTSTIQVLQSEKINLITQLKEYIKKYQAQIGKVKQLQEKQQQSQSFMFQLREKFTKSQKLNVQLAQKLKIKEQSIRLTSLQNEKELMYYKGQQSKLKKDLEHLRIKNLQLSKKQMLQNQQSTQKIYQLINTKLNTDMKILVIYNLLNTVKHNLNQRQMQKLTEKIALALVKNN